MGNSFYGGQDARPFIISHKFKTITEMLNSFGKGLTYMDVNFEEYVLIDCDNKNNPENGRIFRRGYDVNSQRIIESWTAKGLTISGETIDVIGYDDNKEPYGGTESNKIPIVAVRFDKIEKPANGAEYIGQIIGPAGGAPHLDFSQSYNEVQELGNSISNNINGYKGTIELKGTGTIEGVNLIPGYDLAKNEGINKIEWNWCSVRTPDNESTTVYMGFKVPYTIYTFTSTRGDNPYIQPTIIRDNTTIGTNKFYEKWDLTIPKGVKGDTLYSITTVGDNNTNNLAYRFTVRNYDEGNEIYNPNKISTKNYDFPYNIIDSISLSDQGSLTIGQTAKEDYVSGNVINWINEIQFNEDTGVFTFIGNNSNEKVNYSNTDSPISWIKEIDFSSTGIFTFTSNNGNIDYTNTDKPVTWLTEASLSDAGALKFTFNNNTINTVNKTLTWIKAASLNKDTGLLNITFNNNEKIANINETLTWITGINYNPTTGIFNITSNNNNAIGYSNTDNPITYLTEASLSDDGIFNFRFNNDNLPAITKTVDWIKAAGFDTNGNLTLTFANGSCLDPKEPGYLSPNSIMQTITWIKKASLDESTGLLNIQFNNNKDNRTPEIKTYLKWIDTAYLEQNGKFTFKLNTDTTETILNIPIIESADISNGLLTIGLKNGESIKATGSLKQINVIAHDAQNGKLNFTYNDGSVDQIDFPQNFYVSASEPNNAPSGSVWAVIETHGGG